MSLKTETFKPDFFKLATIFLKKPRLTKTLSVTIQGFFSPLFFKYAPSSSTTPFPNRIGTGKL
jgi:hypothetical protein